MSYNSELTFINGGHSLAPPPPERLPVAMVRRICLSKLLLPCYSAFLERPVLVVPPPSYRLYLKTTYKLTVGMRVIRCVIQEMPSRPQIGRTCFSFPHPQLLRNDGMLCYTGAACASTLKRPLNANLADTFHSSPSPTPLSMVPAASRKSASQYFPPILR